LLHDFAVGIYAGQNHEAIFYQELLLQALKFAISAIT
jgi:hypothetical protein